MKLATVSTEVFACYHRACAPPPVGKGGSTKGGRAGARAAKKFEAETKREIQRDKGSPTAKSLAQSLTAKYGSRSASTPTKANATVAKAAAKVSSGRAAADRWSRGETRVTKEAAKALTARFGGRSR